MPKYNRLLRKKTLLQPVIKTGIHSTEMLVTRDYAEIIKLKKKRIKIKLNRSLQK